MANYMQVGDTGVAIRLTVYQDDETTVYDLTGATGLEMNLGPPVGDAIVKTATFTAQSGSDGVLLYATEADVIDVDGTWNVQGSWTDASGNTRHSTVTYMTVFPNIE